MPTDSSSAGLHQHHAGAVTKQHRGRTIVRIDHTAHPVGAAQGAPERTTPDSTIFVATTRP